MRSKFGNKITTVDEISFHSKLEAEFYQNLKIMKAAAYIRDFKMQVKYDLLGCDNETKVCSYYLDFEIYLFPAKTLGENVRHVEAKGVWTPVSKLKKKLFEIQVGKLETHSRACPWKP